jgi:hypothetical protein
MNLEMISQLRYCNHQFDNSDFSTAEEVVSRMGAMQAQDLSMSKWAIGIRLHDSTQDLINREIDSGNIVRMHLLRPTWHFVSFKDVYWILELSGPRIGIAAGYRDRQLELTKDIFRKATMIIENALRDNNHKTREELIAELVKADIRVDNNRASHIFLRAEIDGIICSGRQKSGRPTYALLEEWIPKDSKKVYREEALKELGWRYFSSRGPATLEDFSWWSGLSAKDTKLALELNRFNLLSEIIDNQIFWFTDSSTKGNPVENNIHLSPAYDEFLISYRDRRASLPKTETKWVVSNNGIFYPTILMNGQVIGTWKRNIKNDHVILSTSLFKGNGYDPDELFDKSLTRYSKFINKKVELGEIKI